MGENLETQIGVLTLLQLVLDYCPVTLRKRNESYGMERPIALVPMFENTFIGLTPCLSDVIPCFSEEGRGAVWEGFRWNNGI